MKSVQSIASALVQLGENTPVKNSPSGTLSVGDYLANFLQVQIQREFGVTLDPHVAQWVTLDYQPFYSQREKAGSPYAARVVHKVSLLDAFLTQVGGIESMPENLSVKLTANGRLLSRYPPPGVSHSERVSAIYGLCSAG